MSSLRRSIIFVLKMLASAAFACVMFFALLSLWGIVAAPFLQLESASFLIICAVAVSGAVTVLTYGALSRRLTRRTGPARRR